MIDPLRILQLSKIRGIGDKSILLFLNYAEQHAITDVSDNDIIEIFCELKQSNKRIRIPKYQELLEAYHSASAILDASETNGITTIGYGSPDYPPLLRDIPDPPVLLHAKGNLDALDSQPTIAIIGTRHPSRYGARLGRRFSEIMVDQGFNIVSGLALGCDTIAHEAAVARNKQTIAVLAGGLHSIDTKENTPLAEQIIDKNGLLLSELAYGQNPSKRSFVGRDRIQSGLSYATVIIQTDVKGGTMHTAKSTRAQGRILACLTTDKPNESAHPKFSGNKKLIDEGARRILVAEDVKGLIDEVEALFNDRHNLEYLRTCKTSDLQLTLVEM